MSRHGDWIIDFVFLRVCVYVCVWRFSIQIKSDKIKWRNYDKFFVQRNEPQWTHTHRHKHKHKQTLAFTCMSLHLKSVPFLSMPTNWINHEPMLFLKVYVRINTNLFKCVYFGRILNENCAFFFCLSWSEIIIRFAKRNDKKCSQRAKMCFSIIFFFIFSWFFVSIEFLPAIAASTLDLSRKM